MFPIPGRDNMVSADNLLVIPFRIDRIHVVVLSKGNTNAAVLIFKTKLI